MNHGEEVRFIRERLTLSRMLVDFDSFVVESRIENKIPAGDLSVHNRSSAGAANRNRNRNRNRNPNR